MNRLGLARRSRFGVLLVSALLGFLRSPARAAPPAPALLVDTAEGRTLAAREIDASAAASSTARDVRIWYRSSDGCPDGEAFVARLQALGRAATLARVGDRVDFVVTLAAGSERSAGHLERQTARGTVAIRQFGAPRCEDVAEALALSLELALQPTEEVPAVPAGTSLAAAAPVVNAEPSLPSLAPSVEPRPPELESPRVVPAAEASSVLRFHVGAQGQLDLGLAPGVAPGGALFLALGSGRSSVEARLTLRATYSVSQLDAEELEVGLFAGRLEGCPFGMQASSWELHGCAGGELGMLRAGASGPTGRTERGLWASALGLVRATWQLSSQLAPEIQVAGIAPLLRYTLGTAGGGELFRTEPVLMQLSLGARWSP